MRVVAAAMLLGIAFEGGSRVAPEPKQFRFEREVRVPDGATGVACIRLDAAVYRHSPTLGDVRLLDEGREVPYALLTSQAEETRDTEPVKNLVEHHEHVGFDLEMPGRAYSAVKLDLAGENFVATAKVTAPDSGRLLGTFTLFDLTGQRLGRSMMLALGESTEAVLHVDLVITPVPGFARSTVSVRGAEVPPSREAQTLYTPVAETTNLVQDGSRSVARFELPEHVPVERVAFELEPGDATNFSRAVRVDAKTNGAPDEVIDGEISRVRMRLAGQDLREQRLGVVAVLGSNARDAARVTVTVENGADKPVAIRAVRLEMRERRMCFDTMGEPLTMVYGDAGLARPVYAYAQTFRMGSAPTPAELGAEQENPGFEAQPTRQPFLVRHRRMVWLGLLGIIAVLGALAFRAGRVK